MQTLFHDLGITTPARTSRIDNILAIREVQAARMHLRRGTRTPPYVVCDGAGVRFKTRFRGLGCLNDTI